MKIAVTGPNGRLGSALVRAGVIPLFSDVTNLQEISDEITQLKPDVIINCAAKTNVLWCEEHPKEALEVNYRGVVNLRKSFGGWLIQMSTDWIFGGNHGPYSEYAKPSPLNSYGWSKWGAEVMLPIYSELCSTVVRVTALYDSQSRNFVTDVLSTLSSRNVFTAFTDIWGNPTNINHLVFALQQLISRKLDYVKVLNLTGTDWVSRYNFALAIANKAIEHHRLEPECRNLIIPGTADTLYGKGKYPQRAGFDLTLARKLDLPLHTLDEGLEEFFNAAA